MVAPFVAVSGVSATACPDTGSSTSDFDLECTSSVTLRANVAEVLSISITEPSSWANGDLAYDSTSGTYVSDLLRNKVTVSVLSNNPSGYTAAMYTKTSNTALVNKAKSSTASDYDTIPTLTTSKTAAQFPANYWGYSLDETVTTGTATGNYAGVTTSSNPVRILKYGDGNNNTKDVYFGAKADASTASGTYAQTMVFSVVSGVTTDDPVAPTPSDNPTGPQDNSTNNPVVAYDSTGQRTVYTNTSTNTSAGTTTNTTTISNTDEVDYYTSNGATEVTYAAPQGVTSSSNNGNGVNGLAIGLATASLVAAGTGIGIFAAAKRNNDDDDEE